MDGYIVGALSLAACSLGAGLVASVEVALGGLPKTLVDRAVDEGRGGAPTLARVFEHPQRAWSTLHLLRVFCWLGAGVSVMVLADGLDWHEADLALAAGLALLLWIPAYLLPRALAKQHALRWALWTVWPLRVIIAILSPVVWPLSALGAVAVKLIGGAPLPFWTPGELQAISDRVRSEGLGETDEQLLHSIIQFSDTIIREIMVPRTEMVAIPLSSSAGEVRQTVVDGGHSRIPVYEDTVDNIVGLLHVKDLVRAEADAESLLGNGGPDRTFKSPNIADLLRPTFYVPEVMKISELLREFQRRKTHMAIVVDEYGGTAGVVTLEDIIEEIVGEIQDEYDVEEKQFRVLPDNKIIADGRVTVHDLEEVLEVKFPDDSGFETLAGFLMYEVGYMPEPGATVDWNGLCFTVKEANQKRIEMVEIERVIKGDFAAKADAAL